VSEGGERKEGNGHLKEEGRGLKWGCLAENAGKVKYHVGQTSSMGGELVGTFK
jgi:hypothetical protein